ncbi:MAG: peptide deformylase [Gammaproteobacteria bacterium]|nr:peptide deformylase [Gammaproteobacteria bacterium]
MSVRKILTVGTPSLREPSEEVTKSQIRSPMMRRLVRDMTDTLAEAKGIGLAAPQIGEQFRVVLFDVPEDNGYIEGGQALARTICINPLVTVLDGPTAGFWEGCLSVPGKRGYVERPQHIRLDFMDLAAKPRSMEFEGFLSTVCQHEIDHLDGVLYIDRVKEPALLVSEAEFNETTE